MTDLNVAPPAQISLDDIATWESEHGAVPQGALIAIRPYGGMRQSQPAFPVTNQAAQFLMDARYTIGFIVDTQADFTANRALAQQIALHGNYVVEERRASQPCLRADPSSWSHLPRSRPPPIANSTPPQSACWPWCVNYDLLTRVRWPHSNAAQSLLLLHP